MRFQGYLSDHAAPNADQNKFTILNLLSNDMLLGDYSLLQLNIELWCNRFFLKLKYQFHSIYSFQLSSLEVVEDGEVVWYLVAKVSSARFPHFLEKNLMKSFGFGNARFPHFLEKNLMKSFGFGNEWKHNLVALFKELSRWCKRRGSILRRLYFRNGCHLCD